MRTRAVVREVIGKEDWGIVQLSPRRLQLLRLMAEGKSNKQLAYEMGITLGTVRQYLYRLFKLLKVHDRTQAVVWYLKRQDQFK